MPLLSKHLKLFKNRVFLIIAAVFLATVSGGCGYNRLQQMEEDVFKAWANLESGLIQRTELVPLLAAVAGERTGNEKKALDRLVNAGTWAASGAISVEELENREAMDNLRKSQATLSAAITRLLAKLAADPALKTHSSWLTMKKGLNQIEGQILSATRDYNRKVDQFNAAIRKFPANMTNSLFLEMEPKLHYEGHTQPYP